MAEPIRKKQKIQSKSIKTKSKKNKDIEPKSTVYVNNLPDGLGSQTLRINLFLLFSIYGEVLKVSVNTKKRRGQAFIKMKNIDQANLAKISLNNELFFDKPLKIQFSDKEMVSL